MRRALGHAILALLVSSQGLPAAPLVVSLTSVPAKTEWIGWNESGTYLLGLPNGWQFRTSVEHPASLLLDQGKAVEVPPDVELRCVGGAQPQVRATCVRVRHTADGVTVIVSARRLDFPGGAQFAADLEAFGPAAQALVSALLFPAPTTLEYRFGDGFRATFERVQMLTPEGEAATVATLDAPGVVERPQRLAAAGFWAAAGMVVEATGRRLQLAAEEVGWCQLEGATPRPQPVLLEAPRAQVRVRQATFRRSARVRLPCRLTEPAGLVAEGLRLTVTGAPGVVVFTAADTPEGLQQFLDEVDQRRAGSGHPGDDRFVGALRDFLIPAWCGLWYNPATSREEVREPPTLTGFTATYAKAVEAARPKLAAWLERQAPRYGAVSLARPGEFTAALSAAVTELAGHDRRATVWWSVYLSDLLSGVAGAPVCYWHPDQQLTSAATEGAQVTIASLAAAASEDATPFTSELRSAAAGGRTLDTVEFPRLGPEARLPLNVVIEAGRGTPVGTYQAEVVLSGPGEAKVPLTVRVEPSLGNLFLLALVVMLPVALLWLGASRCGRLLTSERAARRRLARARQLRYRAWLQFRDEQVAAFAGEATSPRAVLARFAELGLPEALSPEAFEAFLTAEQGDAAALAAFLAAVTAELGGAAAREPAGGEDDDA